MNFLLLTLLLSMLTVSVRAQTSYSISFANYVANTSFDSVNNLSTGNWYDQISGLVYTDVLDFTASGYNVDAVLKATSSYSPVTPSTNGKTGNDDAIINMRRSSSVNFSFTLYDADTGEIVDNNFFVGDFLYALVFYDIDGTSSGGLEQVTSYNHDSWTTLADSTVDISNSGTSTAATSDGSINNVQNPNSATSLNYAQQQASVIFNYTNKSSVNFEYTIIGGHVNGERNLLIDGNDFTVFSYPSIPEPSSTLLAGIGAILLIYTRKR